MRTPKKSSPLTPEEMTEAAEKFFPLLEIVSSRMPKDSSAEDTLKVMEACGKLAHQMRSEKLKKEHDERFGFVKTGEAEEDSK